MEPVKFSFLNFAFGFCTCGLLLCGTAIYVTEPHSYEDVVNSSNLRYLHDVSSIACLPGSFGRIDGGGHNSTPGRYNRRATLRREQRLPSGRLRQEG